MLQIFKSLWNYGSGETTEAAVQNERNNDEIKSGDTRPDGRYLRSDTNSNRPQNINILKRKVSSYDKARYQIALIGRIHDASSQAQLDKLQNEINDVALDAENRKIVEGFLQERREILGRNQPL